MFQILFNIIFTMSVVGSVIYVVTYLLKNITVKVFNATWHLNIAGMILLAFLLPVSLILGLFEIDIPNFLTYSEKMSSLIFKLGEGNYLESGMASLNSILNTNIKEIEIIWYRTLLEKIFGSIKYIWISGVFACFALNLKRYLTFKSVVKSSKPVEEDRIYELLNACKHEKGINGDIELLEHSALGTPILTGLLKPTIILPKVEMQFPALELIFSHECIHLKRKHLWIKALLICVGIIHWFNPVQILLRRDINRLCELACDEEVVEKIDYKDRKVYAEIIINMLDKSVSMSGVIHSALNENSKNIKDRLSKILEYQKPKKGMRVLSLLVALGVALLSIPVSAAMAQNIELEVLPIQLDIKENSSAGIAIPKEDQEITFKWPLPSHNGVTAMFGERVNPISKEVFTHYGVDIAAQEGTSIIAAADGEVIFSDRHDGYGLMVSIKHNEVYTTSYAHCSKLLVRSGEVVKAGQEIAEVGSTGKSTGPHLHFEVVKEGEAQDPLTYVN